MKKISSHIQNSLSIPIEEDFADRRDLAISELIGVALRFPGVDPLTGYPKVAINAYARLAGLLFCHYRIESAESLNREIERFGKGVLSIQELGKDAWEDVHIPRWMLRHAQTSLQSVRTQLENPLFQLLSLTADVAQARKIIAHAETVHLPNLLKLIDPIPEADAISHMLKPGNTALASP